MEALMDMAIDASFLFSYTNSAKLRLYDKRNERTQELKGSFSIPMWQNIQIGIAIIENNLKISCKWYSYVL